MGPVEALGLDTAEGLRVLGLFAHPDDEVFCVGGTMAGLTDAGAEGRVVSLTRGEAGEIRDARVATRRTLGQVREAELAAAGVVLGASETTCHRYGDGTLPAVELDELVAVALREIEAFAPDLVVTFGADGAYGHPDHVRASEVATAAASAAGTPPRVLHAAFPRREQLLLDLVITWLVRQDERFRGTQAFANGLLLFANGSSMLGFAADHMDVRYDPAGVAVVEQGEPADELFLVLSGHADVVRTDDRGDAETVARIGPGSFFGEEGLATGEPRNASVVAVDGLTSFVLAPGPADATQGDGPTTLLERIERSAAPPPVPDGCVEVDVRRWAERKMAALACHRSQYAIDADMFPTSMVQGLFGHEWFVPVGAPGVS